MYGVVSANKVLEQKLIQIKVYLKIQLFRTIELLIIVRKLQHRRSYSDQINGAIGKY